MHNILYFSFIISQYILEIFPFLIFMVFSHFCRQYSFSLQWFSIVYLEPPIAGHLIDVQSFIILNNAEVNILLEF